MNVCLLLIVLPIEAARYQPVELGFWSVIPWDRNRQANSWSTRTRLNQKRSKLSNKLWWIVGRTFPMTGILGIRKGLLWRGLLTACFKTFVDCKDQQHCKSDFTDGLVTRIKGLPFINRLIMFCSSKTLHFRTVQLCTIHVSNSTL